VNTPELRTDGISPKAAVATLVALVAPLLIQAGASVVEWLTANPAVFDGLPAWLRFAIATVLTALGVALAAYRARPGAITLASARRR
jgi:hypothetical protein